MEIQHKTFSGEGEGLEKNLAEGWDEQVYLLNIGYLSSFSLMTFIAIAQYSSH